MLTDTVSYVELTFTGVTAIGFVIVAILLRRADANRFYLDAIDAERLRLNPGANPNEYEIERAIAGQHIRSKLVYAVTMLVFVLIGVTAMTREPAGGNGETAATSYVAAVGFIGIAVLMVAASVKELHEDYEMVETIKKRQGRR